MSKSASEKSKDFVFDDTYIEEMEQFFLDCSEKAQLQLDGLLKKLTYACDHGIMEGNTAEYLRMYTERAMGLRNMILDYGKKCSEMVGDFREHIDFVDRHLY